jgi:hypothetical protein
MDLKLLTVHKLSNVYPLSISIFISSGHPILNMYGCLTYVPYMNKTENILVYYRPVSIQPNPVRKLSGLFLYFEIIHKDYSLINILPLLVLLTDSKRRI